MKKMMDSTTAIITTTDNRVLLQKRDENPDGYRVLRMLFSCFWLP